MPKRTVDAQGQIANTPEAVIAHVCDVRNRQQSLSLLQASDVQGDPAKAQQTWKYAFRVMGRELKGTAKATKCEPGKLYEFQTEGDARSTWTYRAEAAGQGTKLTLHVEYEIPDELLRQLPAGTDPATFEQAEAAKMFENLKKALDK
jgi:carbon monoxide dehydrogenase subunit G